MRLEGLLIPGGILTIAAGAIFGLGWGFVAVSIGSTVGASLAFLIGRYVVRRTVQEQTAKYPKFAAVDRAIDEGGWKIIAMLRLVPLFPFNVGNYLLGLTPVRFWPYVLASWIAMMPGTLVYVYLGHVRRLSDEAAVGDAGRHPLEWAILIVGGIVAFAVTVYITRLAKCKLDKQTEAVARLSEPWCHARTIALAAVEAILVVLGACATLNPDWLPRFFGPPAMVMIEHYENEPRIHWAQVCAAVGCPPLRTEAYTGVRIEEQLHEQVCIVHNHERWFRFDREEGVVHLTELYNWSRGDYGQIDGCSQSPNSAGYKPLRHIANAACRSESPFPACPP